MTFPSPPAGWTMLHVDGSFNRRSAHMSCGGLLQNHEGVWIVGFASFEGIGEAFLAELIAVIRGLRLAWQQGIRKLLCYSDCMEVVDALSENRSHNLYSYAAFLSEAKNLLHQDWEVTLLHKPRELNLPADALAKIGMGLRIEFSMWRTPPPEVVNLVGCG
ncbi:uncharacterized protein LOC130712781 [Lotus japonicus]|uniref:uncharacterized protein LOC130712781 n=1 Tax=Lotus japonicus TaxID=34305 RepID=UPI00258AE3ED|nr:uncharacterized protein LOC130712781 [Lotus japonicus]